MSGVLLTALVTFAPVAPAQPPRVEESTAPAATAKKDMVLWWNDILLLAIRTDRTPPPRAALHMATVHIAVYDAVNPFYRTHEPHVVDVAAPAGAAPEAAAAAAAHRVLVQLYPRQRRVLDDALALSLAKVPAGPRERGADFGRFVAEQVLERRKGDRADDAGTYTPGSAAGVWRPTAPGFKAALLPRWGKVRGFAVREGVTRRPPGPPPLSSAAYAAAFREVRALGGKDSAARTPEQTEIALFWADDPGTSTPPGHWNLIAQEVARARGNTLAQNARLFALLNMSLADNAILCWWCKFTFAFWRPITAIRESDENGNTPAPTEPGWTPLLDTPPFPAYTSGHSSFSGAAASVLANFFGTDRVRFESMSEGLPGVRRSFASFSAAAAEAGMSRIYGGIHWQFDNVDGLAAGREVGEYVSREALRPRRARLAPSTDALYPPP